MYPVGYLKYETMAEKVLGLIYQSLDLFHIGEKKPVIMMR